MPNPVHKGVKAALITANPVASKSKLLTTPVNIILEIFPKRSIIGESAFINFAIAEYIFSTIFKVDSFKVVVNTSFISPLSCCSIVLLMVKNTCCNFNACSLNVSNNPLLFIAVPNTLEIPSSKLEIKPAQVF